MGKGDKRTKRGKIWRNSYGKSRAKDNKHAETVREAAPAKK